MGVRVFGVAGLTPRIVMATGHLSTESPLDVGVISDRLLDIGDLSETLKTCEMKFKAMPDEVSVSEDTPLSELNCECDIVGRTQDDNLSLRSTHELSTSLPNLNSIIDASHFQTVNEATTGNSLSDIFCKPNKFIFSQLTLFPGKNGSLSEMRGIVCETKWRVDSMKNQTEDGQHLCSAKDTVNDKNSKHVLAGLPNNACTKNLANLPNTKSVGSREKANPTNGLFSTVVTTENHSCPSVHTVMRNTSAGADSQCVALRTPAGRPNVDMDDSLAGATLSQESDVSNRSSCQTVVDVEQDTTLSNVTESLQNDSYDDSYVDETTTFDVRRRDIMSSDQLDSCDSLSKADASSFSSISSLGTGTDLSASANSCSDDIGDSLEAAADYPDDRFVDINLHPGNTYERSKTLGSEDSGFDEKQMHQFDTKPKRKGITDFLTRGLFSRKSKQLQNDVPCDSGLLGWKFFGRVPPKPTPSSKNADQISREFLEKQKSSPTPSLSSSTASIRKGDVEVQSTTALILQQRPRGLPSKSPEEEEKHRQQYQDMIEAAKRKEAKDVKLRKKQIELQLRHEDELSAALAVWRNEILPNWDTIKSCKKTRDLWWNGVPPSVRGQVWKLAIGNELNLTPELYEICLLRAKDRLKLLKESAGDTDSITSVESAVSKESSVELIKLDVSRTFPQLCIFQKGGPYHELLQSLLGAYVCYRPDVGYVQGMSFIAAVLLLNMDVADAFICFANLLNRPCTIAFFRLDESLVKCYFDTYELLFAENLPALYEHFEKQKVTADLYVIDWMFTLYARSLPLDIASRAWDVFFRDGEQFLFRMALGVLKLYEDILLSLDFIHLAQFLTRLPETMNADDLFHSIDMIHMTVDKKSFQRLLLDCKDREM